MCGGLAKSVVIGENYPVYHRDNLFLRDDWLSLRDGITKTVELHSDSKEENNDF